MNCKRARNARVPTVVKASAFRLKYAYKVEFTSVCLASGFPQLWSVNPVANPAATCESGLHRRQCYELGSSLSPGSSWVRTRSWKCCIHCFQLWKKGWIWPGTCKPEKFAGVLETMHFDRIRTRSRAFRVRVANPEGQNADVNAPQQTLAWRELRNQWKSYDGVPFKQPDP